MLQTKRSAWLGQFNVVCFAPESLTLVKGAPVERRRFLDMLISQVDKNYLSDLQRYRSVLKQRNELLKQFRAGDSGTAQLGVWDELLVASGSAIIVKRLEVLQLLKRYALQKQAEFDRGPRNAPFDISAGMAASHEAGLRRGGSGDSFRKRGSSQTTVYGRD